MEVAFLGDGGSCKAVYGFEGKAFKVARQGVEDMVRAEGRLLREIEGKWKAEQRKFPLVCEFLGSYETFEEAAADFGLPIAFTPPIEEWLSPVLVMTQILPLPSDMWCSLVQALPDLAQYSTCIVRLYLGAQVFQVATFPELDEEARAKKLRYTRAAIGWDAACHVLGLDVASVAYNFGYFMGFLHYGLELDGFDVELQVGGVQVSGVQVSGSRSGLVYYVCDFSHVRSFRGVTIAAKHLVTNEHFCPLSTGPDTRLFSSFAKGYLEAAVGSGSKETAEAVMEEVMRLQSGGEPPIQSGLASPSPGLDGLFTEE